MARIGNRRALTSWMAGEFCSCGRLSGSSLRADAATELGDDAISSASREFGHSCATILTLPKERLRGCIPPSSDGIHRRHMGKQIMSHVAPPADGLVLLGARQDGRLTRGGISSDQMRSSSRLKTTQTFTGNLGNLRFCALLTVLASVHSEWSVDERAHLGSAVGSPERSQITAPKRATQVSPKRFGDGGAPFNTRKLLS
jgi:hypothetical protein